MSNESKNQSAVVRNYWAQKIAGAGYSPAPEAGHRTTAADQATFPLPPGVTDSIRRTAKQNVLSEYVLYLTGYVVLLHTCFGQSEWMVATAGAGSYRAMAPPGGHLLLLALELDDKDSLRQLTVGVSREVSEVLRYGSLPLAGWHELLTETRADAGELLRFGFYHAGLGYPPAGFPTRQLQFSILPDGAGGQQLEICYDGHTVTEDLAATLATRYARLLHQIVADPARSIADVSLLPPTP